MTLIANLIKSINSAAESTLLQCMIIVTAVELCGSFITGKTGQRETKNNFLAFWKSRYMPEKYHVLGDFFYKALRSGVSHSFLAKGGVVPSGEEKSSDKHLKLFKNGIFIYTPQLKKDVVAGIVALQYDIKSNKNNLEEKYDNVLQKLEEDGAREYRESIKEKNLEADLVDEEIVGDIYPDTGEKTPKITYGTKTTGSAVARGSITTVAVTDPSILKSNFE